MDPLTQLLVLARALTIKHLKGVLVTLTGRIRFRNYVSPPAEGVIKDSLWRDTNRETDRETGAGRKR